MKEKKKKKMINDTKKVEVLEDLFFLMQKHGVFLHFDKDGECLITDNDKSVLFGLKTLCSNEATENLQKEDILTELKKYFKEKWRKHQNVRQG